MPDHEFIVKTLETDWLAPMFSGVHLTGDFLFDGGTRVPGTAVLSMKGSALPSPDTTSADFTGGAQPRLAVQFASGGVNGQNIFRDVIFNDWTGFSIVFDQSPLDLNSTTETFVAFKKVKFRRTF